MTRLCRKLNLTGTSDPEKTFCKKSFLYLTAKKSFGPGNTDALQTKGNNQPITVMPSVFTWFKEAEMI